MSVTGFKKVVIIGGGAAGCFCAANLLALRKDIQITLLEKSNKLLGKVKISGGGRCNLTHACDSISEMSKCYPRGEKFVKKAFQSFFVSDTIKWFEQRGVPLKTEVDGRMFPASNSSDSIISCLLQHMTGVNVMMHAQVKRIEKQNEFSVFYNDTSIDADAVCVCCGGFPKLEQYDFLKALAVKVVSPFPSLFTFNVPKHPITGLMGLVANRVELKIKNFKHASDGALLITHWGISGPATLKLSAFAASFLHEADYVYEVQINWNAEFNETSMLSFLRDYRQMNGAKKITISIFEGIPNRLWQFLLQSADINSDQSWGDLSAKQQNTLARQLCAYTLHCNGKTTFKDEFVSAGGVDLSEIDVNTMEHKQHQGLFFAGEVLNVDGITGGYNFQHAWTSGFLAARAITKSC